jgi:hypothetical protein
LIMDKNKPKVQTYLAKIVRTSHSPYARSEPNASDMDVPNSNLVAFTFYNVRKQ